MIRLPQVPSLQPVAIDAPMMRPGAAAAPAVALGQLAESIAGVSDQFHATAIHVQKLENARKVSETRNALARDYAQHQLDLESDPDPASRMQKTAAFLSGYKGRMDDGSLPPAVRDELTQHFDSFATEATIRQAADSAKLAARRASLAMDNELETAMDGGDYGGAHAAVQRFAAAGVILPEQAQAMTRKINLQGALAGVQKQIAADPIAMERTLEDPAWVAKNPQLARAHEGLLNVASRSANRERADFAADIAIAGEEPTLDDLKVYYDYGQISKATYAQWAQTIRAGELTGGAEGGGASGGASTGRRAVALPVDPAIHNETLSAIYGYDPAGDTNLLGLAVLRSHIMSLPVAPEQKKVLNDKLDEKTNPATKALPKNLHESAFHGQIDTAFERGDFGKFEFMEDEDNDPDTKPTKVIAAKERDQAWETRQRFEEEWTGVLATLPQDAPFQVVNAAYQELVTKYKSAKAPPDVTFSKIPAPVYDEDAAYRNAGGTAAPTAQAAKTHTVVPQLDPVADEGVTVPLATLQAQFPERDTAWLAANTRVVARGPGGLSVALPITPAPGDPASAAPAAADIRLSPAVVRQFGGRIAYDKDGKPVDLKGLTASMKIMVVSIDTGGMELQGAQWPDVKAAWYAANQTRGWSQVEAGLVALRQAWQEANTNDPAADSGAPMQRSGKAPLKASKPLKLSPARR